MAVYTQVADESLAAFLKNYSIGEMLSLKGIAEGVENSNYVLRTTSGQYILTLYEKRVKEEDLPFFLGLMQHLAQKRISCPTPISRKDGALYGPLEGRPAAIIGFLEGMAVNRPQPEHCGMLGAALAELHLAGSDFAISRQNSLGLAGWQDLFARFSSQADAIVPGLQTLIEDELAFLSANWPANLPRGVIHADLFPDNVFFLGGRVSGIIDYYFACNDLLAYDLAICLNAWCFETDFSFNITKARALLRGYSATRPLSAAEMDYLPLLARGSALRFLLTRSYDWINTPEGALVRPHDPRAYLKRLRFHQSIETVSEYGL